MYIQTIYRLEASKWQGFLPTRKRSLNPLGLSGCANLFPSKPGTNWNKEVHIGSVPQVLMRSRRTMDICKSSQFSFHIIQEEFYHVLNLMRNWMHFEMCEPVLHTSPATMPASGHETYRDVIWVEHIYNLNHRWQWHSYLSINIYICFSIWVLDRKPAQRVKSMHSPAMSLSNDATALPSFLKTELTFPCPANSSTTCQVCPLTSGILVHCRSSTSNTQCNQGNLMFNGKTCWDMLKPIAKLNWVRHYCDEDLRAVRFMN